MRIRYEQAVYGSFPFWDRGYAVLAHSPGCRPEWLADLRAACQRLGERPSGAPESAGLFALRLASGPWAVVGVNPQGADDRGRPGALAFHALFLDPGDYRKAGADPFAFSGLLRDDWTAETRALPAGLWTGGRTGPPTAVAADGRAARIASALSKGRRVALEAPGPIDALAREVWRALPPATRARASLATWAFGNGNRFDLVALPRLAGVALDATYLDPALLDTEAISPSGPLAPTPRPGARPSPRPRLARALPFLGASALLVGAGIGVWLRRDAREAESPPATSSTPSPPPRPDRAPPDRRAYAADTDDPEERRRAAEALFDLAERTGADPDPGPADPEGEDPAALMTFLAERIRYRGPFLSAHELARLADERAPDARHDAALALEWHARLRRFAGDRPLPDDFATGPLRWQLATLAWSLHLDDVSEAIAGGRSAAEIPHALADALAVDVPLRPTPLTADYPALASYLTFLGKLPRR